MHTFCPHLLFAPAGGEWAARLPTAEHQAWMDAQRASNPHIREYLLQQAPDYRRLKACLLEHIQAGEPGVPAGVVDIDGAVETATLTPALHTTSSVHTSSSHACRRCVAPARRGA